MHKKNLRAKPYYLCIFSTKLSVNINKNISAKQKNVYLCCWFKTMRKVYYKLKYSLNKQETFSMLLIKDVKLQN